MHLDICRCVPTQHWPLPQSIVWPACPAGRVCQILATIWPPASFAPARAPSSSPPSGVLTPGSIPPGIALLALPRISYFSTRTDDCLLTIRWCPPHSLCPSICSLRSCVALFIPRANYDSSLKGPLCHPHGIRSGLSSAGAAPLSPASRCSHGARFSLSPGRENEAPLPTAKTRRSGAIHRQHTHFCANSGAAGISRATTLNQPFGQVVQLFSTMFFKPKHIKQNKDMYMYNIELNTCLSN